MGAKISKKPGGLFGPKEIRLLMVGLNGSGKTTILYHLKCGEFVTTIPTAGFNVETFSFGNQTFTVWDVSNRDLWPHYLENTKGVIFVVDSADQLRLDDARCDFTARTALHNLMSEKALAKSAVLVLASKQDLPGALRVKDITQRLNLSGLKQTWHVQATSGLQGEGLHDGMCWLAERMALKK